MAKKIEILITEEAQELRTIRRKQDSLSKQKRVTALLRIKESSEETREDLANYLGVNPKTLRRWLAEYRSGGIEFLLETRARRKGSKIITKEIHEGLKTRVYNAKNSFLGYWDAQRWVESEFEVEINYHTLRHYLKKHFETKVKRPRKSHVKKDLSAVALFKNAT